MRITCSMASPADPSRAHGQKPPRTPCKSQHKAQHKRQTRAARRGRTGRSIGSSHGAFSLRSCPVHNAEMLTES